MIENYDQERIAATNNHLPLFGTVIATCQYLKVLPFMSPFNGAIYDYPRSDNPNIGLPAIFVYITNGNSTQSGFENHGTINIEVVRNPNTSNRDNIYIFKQSMMERLLLCTVFSDDYKFTYLSRLCPYLKHIGLRYNLNMNFTNISSLLSFSLSYNFGQYKTYRESKGFNPFGAEIRNALIKEIQFIGNIDCEN